MTLHLTVLSAAPTLGSTAFQLIPALLAEVARQRDFANLGDAWTLGCTAKLRRPPEGERQPDAGAFDDR